MTNIFCIIGPTAIGKSDYAIQMAKDINAEIISADAFQVYRHMDIGTAKVSLQMQTQIPHHLIDIKNPNEPYSVAEFVTLTKSLITDIQNRQKSVIICGGTGFYVQALLYNYAFTEMPSCHELKNKIQKEGDTLGWDTLWQRLCQIDPKVETYMDQHNHKRLIRALEIYELSQTLPSDYRNRSEKARSDISIIGLMSNRQIIYDRINKRVEIMIELGLIKEVQDILQMGYTKSCQAFEALGYKQTIDYLDQKISLDQLIDLVQTKTRQFAKRQLTWFRKLENVKWIYNS